MTNLLTLCWGPVGRKASCLSPADCQAEVQQDGNTPYFQHPSPLTDPVRMKMKNPEHPRDSPKGKQWAGQDCGEARLGLWSHAARGLPAQPRKMADCHRDISTRQDLSRERLLLVRESQLSLVHIHVWWAPVLHTRDPLLAASGIRPCNQVWDHPGLIFLICEMGRVKLGISETPPGWDAHASWRLAEVGSSLAQILRFCGTTPK